jgi:O-methyltransferase involved in polyketide biosynthesis
MKIELKNISETLLLGLWSRAKISKEYSSVLNDTKAIELVEKIDYDFSKIDKALGFEGLLMHSAVPCDVPRHRSARISLSFL